MTPSDIEVLLHCHTTPSPHPRLDVPSVKGAIQRFFVLGLIEKYKGKVDVYVTTAGGELMVKALCLVPLPTMEWTHPLVPAQRQS